jgi:hypothetical protein
VGQKRSHRVPRAARRAKPALETKLKDFAAGFFDEINPFLKWFYELQVIPFLRREKQV